MLFCSKFSFSVDQIQLFCQFFYFKRISVAEYNSLDKRKLIFADNTICYDCHRLGMFKTVA